MKNIIIALSLAIISMLMVSYKPAPAPAFSLTGKWKGHETVKITYQDDKQETFVSDFYIRFNSDQSFDVIIENDVILKRLWGKFLRQQGVEIRGYTWIPRSNSSGLLQLDASCTCPDKIKDDGTRIESEYVEMFKKLRRSKVSIYHNDEIGVHVTKANGEKHEIILKRQ